MALLSKQINLIAMSIVITTAISLVACTEKAEDGTQTETVVSTVTEDKIAQLQREAREGILMHNTNSLIYMKMG